MPSSERRPRRTSPQCWPRPGSPSETNADSGERLDVDRVVTLPTLSGPAIHGLPHDAAGFLPVDPHGRVKGVTAVYAAGDATDFEIKQGGLACQQADVAAQAIAADAGLPIEPTPFVPLLQGALVTEHHIRWLGGDGRASPRAR